MSGLCICIFVYFNVCARVGWVQVLGPACVPGQGMQGSPDSPLLPANEPTTHLLIHTCLHAHIHARTHTHTATPTYHIDQGFAPRVAVRPVSQPLRTKRLRTHRPPAYAETHTQIHTCKHVDMSSVFSPELDLDAAAHTKDAELAVHLWAKKTLP